VTDTNGDFSSNTERKSYYLFVVAAACLVAVFLPTHKAAENDLYREVLGETTIRQFPIAEKAGPVLLAEARAFDIKAKSALAVDVRTRAILYQKNSQLHWPTASLAKLMTALVISNITPQEAIVTVMSEDLKVSQPVMGLTVGEKIRVSDLLKGMLVMSANDAANVLARSATGSTERFVDMMNFMAQKLGLQNTHFKNPAGFDDPEQYSTAEDLLTLTYEFLRNSKFADIVQTQLEQVASTDGVHTHDLRTSNRLLEKNNILGVKTGYTEGAKGNLILLASDDSNNQIITVVLGSENREDDSMSLVDWVFKSYEYVK